MTSRAVRRGSIATAAVAVALACGGQAAAEAGGLGAGVVRGSEPRTIELWLAGREQAAQRFVDAVSTPGSPMFGQFLSPVAYTQRFGPSAGQLAAVRSYLTRAGFTDMRASVNHDYVSATAPAATADRAFAVPGGIGHDVLAVTGLDSAPPQNDNVAGSAVSRRTRASKPSCSRYWAQRTMKVTPAFDGLTRAAVPVCGYSARQIRAAYGLTGGDTGAGVTVAIVQTGPPFELRKTLTDYARVNHLPTPRPGQYRQEAVTRGPHRGRCANGALEESPIDSESVYAAAPRANQLIIAGNDCDTRHQGDQALLDAELAPLTGHGSRASAQIESSSYSFGASATPSLLRASHAIALRAAAEGVSLLIATGDSPGVEDPSSDPDVTAVGGTTLGIGAHRNRLFETGWSDLTALKTADGPWKDDGVGLGTAGGVSSQYPEPGYQRAVVPRAMSRDSAGHPGRTLPDISADADPFSGLMLGYIDPLNGKATPYTPFVQAGTSSATPLVAGIVADAEHGRTRPLGFLNPLLYSLAGGPAFHDILPVSPSTSDVDRAFTKATDIYHGTKAIPATQLDILDAQVPGDTHQVTARGYDTMTGLGTPNGPAFIKALRSAR